MTRLLKWERLALKGDFSAMPGPFEWDQSGRFAHFLNGYDVAGGMDPLAGLAIGMSEQARKIGKWDGSALDLWLCLFFQHRAHRHMGSEDSDPILDELCEALRVRLSRLSPAEAKALASRLNQNAA
ncbi:MULTISPECIES: hypothetical protein [unclassified Mesorhizobium]|uniref:hypothetical protein n=1 Tax=unclassified Mesorhizobium TaxID=325217 RepID=UPI0003CE3CBC|nr:MULTISPECIES: hypothetical protein [unclassified Mesorhizobium]ESX98810.1 hypothetical protein X752_29590 [Mesorhizobium sp. LNJC398B00]ESY27737.1 hypothetical protein X749_22015 [Mesorhizobium sp. LNJC391B00]